MRLLILLALCGCTWRSNPGAQCAILICDAEDIVVPGAIAQYDPNDGTIMIRRALNKSETIESAMHEFVHACEHSPGIPPREVLRRYSSKALPMMGKDLIESAPGLPSGSTRKE